MHVINHQEQWLAPCGVTQQTERGGPRRKPTPRGRSASGPEGGGQNLPRPVRQCVEFTEYRQEELVERDEVDLGLEIGSGRPHNPDAGQGGGVSRLVEGAPVALRTASRTRVGPPRPASPLEAV